MQVLGSTDVLYSSGVKCIDTGTHTILNSVPYDKVTNSPVPFNNISLPCDSRWFCGENGMNLYEYSTGYLTFNILDKKFKNVIVDNLNPNISYTILTYDALKASSDTLASNDFGTGLIKIVKLHKHSNGKLTFTKYIIPSTIYTMYPFYITQDDENLYILVKHAVVQTNDNKCLGNNQTVLYVINKQLNHYKIIYLNLYNLSDTNIAAGISPTSVNVSYGNTGVCKVLYENSEGFLIYMTALFHYAPSSTPTSYYVNSRYMWFSFKNKIFQDVTVENISTTHLYTFPTKISTSTNTISTSNTMVLQHGIPSQLRKINNTLCGYVYALSTQSGEVSNLSANNWSLFNLKHDGIDVAQVSISPIDLIFQEDASITALPTKTTSLGSSNWYANAELSKDCFETFFTVSQGGINKYIHIVYKGIVTVDPMHGIYTFKLNEDETEAQFISFYSTLGGTLDEFIFLNEANDKIALATTTSYHILKFDTESENWVSTFDSLNKPQSIIQTRENKLYVHLLDGSIVCHDLEGAVVLDFDFEKQSYNYNNADIDSYITIWAKDSNEEYVATDTKLTIVGDAVWKNNGQKTIEFTTSSDGPVNVPFTIKSQTTINVSVDAII